MVLGRTGGGALLDVGIYPLTLAIALLGELIEAHAVGDLAATGVDAQMVVAMRHPDALSSWACSFTADLGYRLEVREVHRCLADGLMRSPAVGWESTVLAVASFSSFRDSLAFAATIGRGAHHGQSVRGCRGG